MIDLSELLDEAAKNVPVGGGKVWRLYPPTAWDRLRLEQHLQALVADSSMPSDDVWRDISQIVLESGPQPGGLDRAVHELPVEISVPLVWWAWLHWCRGEAFADRWVKSLGKATVALLATKLPIKTTDRGSISTESESATRSPDSTSPTDSPRKRTGASVASPGTERAPAGATSSLISAS